MFEGNMFLRPLAVSLELSVLIPILKLDGKSEATQPCLFSSAHDPFASLLPVNSRRRLL